MTIRSGRPVLLAASMLAMAMALPLPAGAFTPPPPLPPCVPAQADLSAAALGAIIAGNASPYAHRCAVKDLAARGAAAMPVILPMLGPGTGASLLDALEVVAAVGPDGHAALPLLVAHVRQPPAMLNGLYRELYDALGALGPAARPAIPLLLEKTGDPAHYRHALRVLGKLGKYDDRVVPHLSAMLIDSVGDLALLDALATIGKDARGALPAVLGAIEQARVRRDGMQGWAALHALAAIGEPGESLPVLTGLLDDPVLGEAAAKVLRTLGSAEASAAPVSIDAFQRPRRAAVSALASMEAPKPISIAAPVNAPAAAPAPCAPSA